MQEALDKIEALIDLRPQLQWHLIGPLQSNKTRAVAEHFDWVHSIDRLRMRRAPVRPAAARAAAAQCLHPGQRQRRGQQRAAWHLKKTAALAQAVAALPRLRLRA